MSTQADDVVSNDGSWGDVYDDTKPAVVTGPLETTGEQSSDDVTMREAPAEQSGDRAEQVAEEEGAQGLETEQSNHLCKTDDEEVPMDLDDGSASEVKYLPVKQMSKMNMAASTRSPVKTKQQDLNEPAANSIQPNASEQQIVDAANELQGAEVEFSSDSDDTSSSDDSSSDSDDSDDSDTPIISREEAEAMLDKYDDDEGDGNSDPTRAHRTQGEEAMVAPDIGDVVIKSDTELLPLGRVIQRVGSTIVVKSTAPIDKPQTTYRAPGSKKELTITTEHLRVLERGSVVCNADKELLGGIADTIGQVQEPLYIIMFPELTDELVHKLKIDTHALIMYSPEHAIYALTNELKQAKYTDASDVNDNEDMNVEFSDDETEAAYKREYNAARKERSAQQKEQGKGRGGRGQQDSLPTRAEWLKNNETRLQHDNAQDPAREHLNQQISQARRTMTTNVNRGMPAEQAMRQFVATEKHLRGLPQDVDTSPASSHPDRESTSGYVYDNFDAVTNKESEQTTLNYDDDSAGEATPAKAERPADDGYKVLERPADYGTRDYNTRMLTDHKMAQHQQRARGNADNGRGRGRGRGRGNQRGRGNRGRFDDRRQQRGGSYSPPDSRGNQYGDQGDPFYTGPPTHHQPQAPAPAFPQAGPNGYAMPSQPPAFAPFPPGHAPGFAPPQQPAWPPSASVASAAMPYAAYQQQAPQQQMYAGQQYQQAYAAYGQQYQQPPPNPQQYPPAPQYYFNGQQQGYQGQQGNQ